MRAGNREASKSDAENQKGNTVLLKSTIVRYNIQNSKWHAHISTSFSIMHTDATCVQTILLFLLLLTPWAGAVQGEKMEKEKSCLLITFKMLEYTEGLL